MPAEAAQFIYGTDIDSLQKMRLSGNMPLPDAKTALYDISQSEAYAQYHLSGAVSANFEDIVRDTAAFQKTLGERVAVFVCERGARSHALAHLLESHGIPALSLGGGMMEWSRLDLPREVPSYCPHHSR